jgi:diacylglycerol kinase
MKPKHSLVKSFSFASEGFKVAFLTGRNFRIQIFAAVLATIIGVVLKISNQEWVTLILIMAMVLILELINTSIEAIVDMVSPEISQKAKLAKDVSAASVLVAAIASVFIGLFLFLPKILQ